MRQKEPYTLFPRKAKNGKDVWYYRTYDSNGTRTTAKTTGQTSKTAARVYVTELLKKGALIPRQDPTFKDYVADWWMWDRCRYVRGKRARGDRISRTYVQSCRGYLDHHILPYLGKFRISTIKPRTIEDWLMGLRKKKASHGGLLSPSTINQVLTTLKLIFKEGVRIGDFSYDPTATIQPLKEINKEKSFLDPAEIKALFDERKIQEQWKGNFKHYSINLLAASTGMRLGECQALQNRYVHEGYIDVEWSWDRKYGLEEPKYSSKRAIPIPAKTFACLRGLVEISPYTEPTDFVFWGHYRERPTSQRNVLKFLYSAFEKIGISKEQRIERNITFHSWRHFFNSFFRTKIPDAKLQRLTGHRTQEMTEWYTKFKIADFQDVLKIQEEFFK